MRAKKFELDTVNVDVFNYTKNYYLTRLFNSLSLLFCVGERSFIESIRYYEKELTPELLSEAKIFYREEGWHSAQHAKLNKMLKDNGYDTENLEKAAKRKLKILSGTPSNALLTTTCLEIFTAYGAELLMAIDKVIFKDNEVCDMWRWHASEEAGYGHRTIAHKVLNHIGGVSRIKMTIWFILTTILLAVQTAENYISLSEY